MLYYLHNFSGSWGPLRLFEYVTFRAGFAFLTAFLVVVVFTPCFLPFFRKHCMQKSARTDDAVETRPRPPIMGGLIIIGALVISTLLWGRITERILTVFLLSTIALAILGFIDDMIKTKYLRSERDGVKERTKLIVQAIVAVCAIYALYKTQGTVTMKVFCPFFKQPFQFLPGTESIAVWLPFTTSPLFHMPLYLMPLCLLVMLGFNYGVLAGTSNGVNLTDGKDGLAPGCMFVASIAFAVIAYLSGHKVFAEYLDIPYIANAGEVGIFACGIAGSCLGFLWHNCQPADIIMGDTGSLALGGALALIAIMLGQQLLLPVIGFVFLAEALSSWLQRKSYRWRHGKRIFLKAPVHHHFEKLGIPDNRITIRFWIVAILCALAGLATLKLH